MTLIPYDSANTTSYQHGSLRQVHHNRNDDAVDNHRQANLKGMRASKVVVLVFVVCAALLVVMFGRRDPTAAMTSGLDRNTALVVVMEPGPVIVEPGPSSHCHFPSVIVDKHGIIEDGIGSDGICNDTALWYDDQLIDHFAKNRHDPTNQWSQKYFINDDYFRGPGHPIFYIMGGEDVADCLFYPFVTHNLARIFGGLTLEAEHRFYGDSQPIQPLQNVSDLQGLLTVEQVLADYLRLLKVTQQKYGCSLDRKSPHYCPVVTVGASYPGFLSAMLRLVHSDVVDIGYASSSPLKIYSQQVDPHAYFDKVTQIADQVSPGCSHAIKRSLLQIQKDVDHNDDSQDLKSLAKRLGICADQLPAYIDTKEVLWDEVLFAIAANFADFNMENYPPSPTNDLNRACHAFQSRSTGDAYDKLQALWRVVQTSEDYMADGGDSVQQNCFDLNVQIPDGPHGTVTCSDWTGCGGGISGLSWDFQLCTELVVQAGYSRQSMFPHRRWTLEALTEHCQSRFGVTPTPTRLVDKWHFDDLVGQGASRLLFPNGLRDGWSSASYTKSLSPSIVAINMPNGAHRSDLEHHGPRSIDTDDVRHSRKLILKLLTEWLTEIKAEMHSQDECR